METRRKIFENNILRWAFAADILVSLNTVNINGQFAYYMHPSVQDMWEYNGGVSPAQGKDY